MLNLDGWMPYFAVTVLSYAAFVFISENFNPFKFKLDQSRRRWRLGRSIALILFFVPTFALLLLPYTNFPHLTILYSVLALCSVLSLYPIYLYQRLSNTSLSTRTNKSTNQPATVTATSQHTPNLEKTASSAISLSSAQHVTIAAEDVEALDKVFTKQEPVMVSVSEEHQLELEISESNHESNFDNLDQTIAEADFFDADLTTSETTEVAQPNLSSSSENTITNKAGNQSNQNVDLSDQNSVRSSSFSRETPDTDQPVETDILLQMLDTKNSEIDNLAKSNHSLIKDRESLVDEVSELKRSIQKVNTIARKGIAQRDQALKLKNSALTLAAMERKKRKLTEVKARKALMKMSNSMKALTDQRA